MLTILGHFLTRDEGATALEYSVLVIAIVLALLLGATVFGGLLGNWFAELFPFVEG